MIKFRPSAVCFYFGLFSIRLFVTSSLRFNQVLTLKINFSLLLQASIQRTTVRKLKQLES